MGLALALISWVNGCRDAGPEAPRATVYFSLDAPLCSSVIPVAFFIDHTLAGTDTFRVNVAGEHTTSRGFATGAGTHTVGARASIGTGSYVWPDTAVSLAAEATYTRSLPLYCS